MSEPLLHTDEIWTCPICGPLVVQSQATPLGFGRLLYAHDVAFIRQSDPGYQPPYDAP